MLVELVSEHERINHINKMSKPVCYYELLGLAERRTSPDLSAEEIAKSYKKAALRWHPDKA